LTHKVDQTDLVFGVHQRSLVCLCMQGYKSLCAAVTIYSILVNTKTVTHTHTHTERARIDSTLPAYLISSASWAKNTYIIVYVNVNQIFMTSLTVVIIISESGKV